MAIIKIRNAAIDLDAAEIPNLPATKITSGTLATARLGSGTANNSTFLRGDQSYQPLSEFNDDKLVNDISTLALHQATNNNSAKYNLTNSNVDVYQDSSAIANLTNVSRDTTGEYISSVYSEVAPFTSDSDTIVLAHFNDTALGDSSSNNFTPTKTSGITRSSTQSKFGGYSAYSDGTASEYWQVKPELMKSEIGFEADIEGTSAALVIGDRAFDLNTKYDFVYDLSAIWKEMTGFPFVFATWVANRELSKEFVLDFQNAMDYGLCNIQKALFEEGGSFSSDNLLEDYLNNKISYILDNDKLKGMELFLSKI